MYRVFGHGGEDGRRSAQALLRAALAAAYGLKEVPAVARAERGKPYFPDCPGIHFNLSHSGGLCLCAVGDGEVGVDIELVRPRRDLDALARRAFSQGEYRWFGEQGGGLGAFYTLWTRKEALAKYTGEGIGALRAIDPPLPGEDRGALTLCSWAGEDWRAALCCCGAPPGEIEWLRGL